MNIRKKLREAKKLQEPQCANCFACKKGSEYCYLTEKTVDSQKLKEKLGTNRRKARS